MNYFKLNKLFVSLLIFVIIMSFVTVIAAAQEDEVIASPAIEQMVPVNAPAFESAASTHEQAMQEPAKSLQDMGIAAANKHINTVKGWINIIIASISQIGAMFGQAAGMRIGGTTGMAAIMFVIANFLKDKVPGWIKWILYAGGGTMLAGGGANIVKLLLNV